MPQSTVQISIDTQREKYHKALIMKIAEFKKFITEANPEDLKDRGLDRLLVDAISFKNLFEIKASVITLTRDDVDLLTRILNTSA